MGTSRLALAILVGHRQKRRIRVSKLTVKIRSHLVTLKVLGYLRNGLLTTLVEFALVEVEILAVRHERRVHLLTLNVFESHSANPRMYHDLFDSMTTSQPFGWIFL